MISVSHVVYRLVTLSAQVINYNNTEYDDMLKKAIGIEPRAKVAKPVVEEEEEESEEESDDEEEKDSPGKPKSGQGRGKDIGNHSSEGDDNNEKPKPIKMSINKKMKKKLSLIHI